MEFIYGKQDFCNMERGQENCYLLTNGLGGYSSLTMIGSCARNDHALLMAGVTAPVERRHMLSRMGERVTIKKESVNLSSQQYVKYTANEEGYRHLNCFSKECFPIWDYQVKGLVIRKSLVLKYGENTLGILYQVRNEMETEAELLCTPWMQFVSKGEIPKAEQKFITTDNTISSEGAALFYQTNGQKRQFETQWLDDCYYEQDARDGRPAVGRTAATHEIVFSIPAKTEKQCYIIYSLQTEQQSIAEYDIHELFKNEAKRQAGLVKQAGIRDSVGAQLVQSGDCFLANRESTGEKTILAGYPFFGDWGRDTMIAVSGLGIGTGRYEETKSIFRSFLRYTHKGLMPNMFPESGENPLYNTVDASVLFICAVYEYYTKTDDTDFLAQAWTQMEHIISWYEKGTDFHIRMDEDGLLMAGESLEQVTWMDIRFGDILPTPRHGKPVEVNVWWYNSLKAMEVFALALGKNGDKYEKLAKQTKISFEQKFWNEEHGCLKDTVSGERYDTQIRCNQIWAVSAPFSILCEEKERQVLCKVHELLYTPYGLRTLSPQDEQFKPVYGGTHFERDMAYHQGTVWPFPLGAYYIASLKVDGYSREAKERVRAQLKPMEACLREGCIGQIAEVYDGLVPGCSKGCFAQAWSVAELLKVYAALEQAD